MSTCCTPYITEEATNRLKEESRKVGRLEDDHRREMGRLRQA